ncbi:MAG: Eco57I restriction-modification methylase domain-containing protein [Promethearchaeota archaeon]|jgi:hypothetical protein
MAKLSARDFLSNLKEVITEFETKKANEKTKNKRLGITYTPQPVVDYIVLKAIKLYFEAYLNLPEISNSDSYYKALKQSLLENPGLKNELIEKLQSIRILDPASGSGRFLISVAEALFKFHKILNSNLTDFKIKKKILQENVFGIEIETSAYIITKLRLIFWLMSDDTKIFETPNFDPRNLHLEEIDRELNLIDVKLNLYNLDFLLEYGSETFDIIIGNPPYVENKKIKNVEFKRELRKRFRSAYRLFDLSIVFIEKSLELLKENEGCLSMVTTNKFLSADYGIQIRQLLINNTELKEIINISSLPIFENTAAYPIILSFKKSIPEINNIVLIKEYKMLNQLVENYHIKPQELPQKLIKRIPGLVIPITGKINLIKYLYTNFKSFSDSFQELKIIYRPYGFINWSKHLNNVNKTMETGKDLLLIGTGNVGKYHIKFDKPIKIAKRNFPIAFFKYRDEYRNIWKDLKSQKLIFREIAKDLTWVYDPGLYTNVTGLYFVRFPSMDQNDLFCLLAIMNSKLMDIIFKTLFSTLHMAGGYLRINGSFIKRLPVPMKLPLSLSQFGKILQVLSQLQYDLNSEYKSGTVKVTNKFLEEIAELKQCAKKVSESLVHLLFLDKLYLESNNDYNFIRDLLYSKFDMSKLQFKYLWPRYQLNKYEIYRDEEMASILKEIKNTIKIIYKDKNILSQMDEILNNELTF